MKKQLDATHIIAGTTPEFRKGAPCNLLNDAIRHIKEGDTDSAIESIANAIDEAGGYYHDDVIAVVEALRRKNNK